MGVKWLRLVLLGIRRIPEKMLASLKKYHNIFGENQMEYRLAA